MNASDFAGQAPPHSIRSNRLVIRCWAPEDAPLLKDAIDVSLEHLRPWMPWAHQEPSEVSAVADRLAMFREKFLAGEDWIYGIFDAEERKVIGGSGLHPRIGTDGLEIGYWIRVDEIGNGFATEDSAALTRIAFEWCDVQRLEIRCDPRNAASAAIPPKLGYRHQTTLIGNMLDSDNNPRDTMVWAMTREPYATEFTSDVMVEAFDREGKRVL